ncbi:MAG: DUF4124 domain-containing protein [Burkholderiales bacterium]
MNPYTSIVGWMAVALITPVAAAEIYRCGPDGSTYSQTPCADGRRIDILDARSDKQRLQARQVSERTAALASSLERDRLASEAANRPTLAGSLSAPLKKVSSDAPQPHGKSKAKRMRTSSQAAKRHPPKPPQDVVLAQPRS